MKSFLLKKLKLEPWQVFIRKVPLDFSFAFPISARLGAENPELVYSKYKPVKRLNIKRGGLIDYIKKNDILLYYPYDSIQTFIDLLYEAGNNPDVVSVKISLYRVANKSRIVSALAYAAEQGKEVICVLELRARFDEENNINYAEVLEASGCTVIYGLGEYKVHAKLCHITLRKPDGEISFITQIGTGNYNEKTCEQYTDLSLITADYDIGLDGAEIFGALCEGEVVEESGCLWVGPKLYLPRLGEEIEKEIQKGEKGRIRIKINAMNNVCVMDKLCEASKAGVKIDLMIRGLCCLPPGIKNISENIRVKSAVGKYLEHSRILCFGEGDEARLYIGSGDFLTRNLLKRVEVFVPIKSHDIKQELIQILDVYSADNQMSYFMKSDGSYVPLFDEEEKNTGEKDAQTIFEDYYTKNYDL